MGLVRPSAWISFLDRAMPYRPLPEKFHVAFSFAGEQRDFVRVIVLQLQGKLNEAQAAFEQYLTVVQRLAT